MQRKRFTAGQMKLQKILERMGIEVIAEYHAGPYCIDLFSTEYQVGFEYDGPKHFRNRDAKRDIWIKVMFDIDIFRISNFSDPMLEDKIKEFLEIAKRQESE